jgi:hypothetical protein
VFDQRILDELQDLALAWGEIVHVGSCMCVQILFLYTVTAYDASATPRYPLNPDVTCRSDADHIERAQCAGAHV